MVIRFYYRFPKSGCAFFTKKHVYLRILTDRRIHLAHGCCALSQSIGFDRASIYQGGATYGCEDKPEAGAC